MLAVRGLDGTTDCYPLVENVHRDGILRVSRAPAPGVADALSGQAATIATKLLDDFDYVGVLAVELFDVDGKLLANEIAPRVHNSGHWTIEGAETSQFENHLRAVLGWPLGSTAARGHSAMVNCIGEMPDRDAVLAVPGAHLHDYGKAPRPNRKVGHVTLTASTPEELEARLDQLREAGWGWLAGSRAPAVRRACHSASSSCVGSVVSTKSVTTSTKRCGSSAWGKWPESSKITSWLPGISSCAADGVVHRDHPVVAAPEDERRDV